MQAREVDHPSLRAHKILGSLVCFIHEDLLSWPDCLPEQAFLSGTHLQHFLKDLFSSYGCYHTCKEHNVGVPKLSWTGFA